MKACKAKAMCWQGNQDRALSYTNCRDLLFLFRFLYYYKNSAYISFITLIITDK